MNDAAPARGDIVWVDLDPRVGHEQSGHRPVLVLSSRAYNLHGRLIGCPMTSRLTGRPFSIVVSRDPPSAILADQVRSLDWRARGARFKEYAPPAIVAEVVAKVAAILAG